MARNTAPKASSPHPRSGRITARDTMAMLVVRGDPIAALKGFKLEGDAKVAIVSSSAEAVRKMRSSGGRRFEPVREIHTGEPPGRSAAPTKRPATIDREAFEPDARSRALLAGVRIAQEDLREAGGAYDLEQVRTLMRGVSRQAIDKRVQEGSLLAVPGPSNRRAYPTLQFTQNGEVVQGLKAVREALATRNGWTVLNFLAHPDDRLGGRKPIDVLQGGDIELVVEAARRVGQQGA